MWLLECAWEENVMRASLVIGVALILLGLVSFAHRGITYTTREKIVDLGPVEATAEKEKSITLPPVVGGVALAGGILLVIAGVRKT
jgi:drug/metabolite transporter (DMT)-like permease